MRSHKQAASEKAAESREKISQSVDDTKEKAKAQIEEFKERHSAWHRGKPRGHSLWTPDTESLKGGLSFAYDKSHSGCQRCCGCL
jgi:hypothetical protein